MHNASCMAGMAFTNAFLGICHSLAHKVGGQFHLPHGRSIAIMLPHVVRYNGSMPTKFAAFPKYEEPIADKKYQAVAKALGLSAETPAQGVESLAKAIEDLMVSLNVPTSLSAAGVSESNFDEWVDDIALKAFDDQCTGANPRYPLVDELKALLYKAYKG
jgi:acetaldehyde dehydrogenase/alcohol dehydrogenase